MMICRSHCVHVETLICAIVSARSSHKGQVVLLGKFNHKISHWLAGLDVTEICPLIGHWVGVILFDPYLQLPTQNEILYDPGLLHCYSTMWPG